MAWIESHTVLIRHPKVRALAHDLRIRRSYAMGHLHALWHAALELQEDGDISSWSNEIIAESSDYPGDAPQWVRLLQQHGFLDDHILHDWLDYVGLYLIKKYGGGNNAAGREKLTRIWAKHGQVYGEANDKRTISEPKANLPNLTLPNLTIPTEKKREAVPAFALPDWVDPVTWKAYKEMRVKVRRPLTESAQAMAISKLEKLKEQGHDPNLVLKQSIFNSWQGLFPLKKDTLTQLGSGNKAAPIPGKYDHLGDKA